MFDAAFFVNGILRVGPHLANAAVLSDVGLAHVAHESISHVPHQQNHLLFFSYCRLAAVAYERV
jgi:hypothetical protein